MASQKIHTACDLWLGRCWGADGGLSGSTSVLAMHPQPQAEQPDAYGGHRPEQLSENTEAGPEEKACAKSPPKAGARSQHRLLVFELLTCSAQRKQIKSHKIGQWHVMPRGIEQVLCLVCLTAGDAGLARKQAQEGAAAAGAEALGAGARGRGTQPAQAAGAVSRWLPVSYAACTCRRQPQSGPCAGRARACRTPRRTAGCRTSSACCCCPPP